MQPPIPESGSETLAPTNVLQGKTALVTGAARRVGATIARVLHGAGANVVLHYRSSVEDAAQLARELNEARPGSAQVAECDLLRGVAARRTRRPRRGGLGGLDILVNNASTFYPTPLGDITEIDWDDLVGTNLKAPLFLAQAAAAALRERQGLIINLADIHGVRPAASLPGIQRRESRSHHADQGAGARARTAGARQRGRTRTRAVARGRTGPRAARTGSSARTALQRAGSPLDVARTCLFFAAEAPYVTGQVLAVDGGRSIGW